MSDSTSIWDDREVIPANEFVRFEAEGDTVSGTITGITKHRFDDGSPVPQLAITTDDGREVTVTAGQIRLKMALAELRPNVGDHVAIRLTRIEKRTGGKTLKHFDVKVDRPQAPPF